jgi:hypothetical protein
MPILGDPRPGRCGRPRSALAADRNRIHPRTDPRLADDVPLIIASATAYAASVLLLDRSILTEKIARRGQHLTSDYTTDPLATFFVADVMRPEPSHMTAAGTVGPRDTLRHAANVFARSGGLPLRVVAPDGTEEGHLLLQDIFGTSTVIKEPQQGSSRTVSSKAQPNTPQSKSSVRN